MKNGFFSWGGHTPGMQLLLLSVTVIVSAALFTALGALLSGLIFGVSILDNPDILSMTGMPDVLPALKLMQILQHVGLFIVPALAFAYMVARKPLAYLSLNKRPLFISYFLAAVVMFLSLPVINWMIMVNEGMSLPDFMSGIEEWMKQSEAGAAAITEEFLKMDSVAGLCVNLIMIAIIPAVGEELLFRGVIQRIVINRTNNIHWGIWIAAMLFSALHMQFYGFLPRMMLGVLFGYLYVWSGSLLLPVFCHLLNNGSAVIYSYVQGAGELAAGENSFGTASGESLYTIGSAMAIAALLFLIYKREKEEKGTISV